MANVKGRRRTLGDKQGLLFIRASQELIDKVDRAAVALGERNEGMRVTRSDAIRVMLHFASASCAFIPGRERKPDENYFITNPDAAPEAEPQPAEPLVFDPDAVLEAEPQPAEPLVLDPDAVLKAEPEPAVPKPRAQRPKRKPAAKTRKPAS